MESLVTAMKSFLILLLLIFGSVGAGTVRAEGAEDIPSVVALRFTPANEELRPWANLLARDVERGLLQTYVVRRMDDGYGRRKLGLSPKDDLSEEQAVRLARLVEARRVWHGELSRPDGRWLAKARCLSAATGEGERIVVEGDDWWQLRDRLMEGLLAALGVELEGEAKARVFDRWTKLPEAIEVLAQYSMDDLSDERREALAEKLVELDPESPVFWSRMASVRFNQSQAKEFSEAAAKVLALDPEGLEANEQAGVDAMLGNRPDEAETRFRRCVGLHPGWARGHATFGKLLSNLNRQAEALEQFQRAHELDPKASEHVAGIAESLVKMGRVEEARPRLQEAIALADGEPPERVGEYTIGATAAELGDYPAASKALRRSLRAAETEDAGKDVLDLLRDRIERVEERLKPVAVEAVRPRTLTAAGLQGELDRRLTPDERALVVDPFEATEEMRAWARELVKDCEDDAGRARAIFDAIAFRPSDAGPGGTRTAMEVFAAWADRQTRFSCQECAKLFVVLAREVGLGTFYVHLERDCEDRVVYHDCAAVFLDGKCYLVDPAYQWFGVPHRNFVILDDVEAVAHHLFQPQGAANPLARLRVAEKLDPDLPWGLVRFAAQLIGEKQYDAAGEMLDRAESLEAERWDVAYHRGQIAMDRGDGQQALALLEEARKRNPRSGEVLFQLGKVMASVGREREAREHVRTALRVAVEDELREAAAAVLAVLNEMLGETDDSPVANGRRLMEAGRFDEALVEFRAALEDHPESAVLRVLLADCLRKAGRGREAAEVQLEALRVGPGWNDLNWVQASNAFGQEGLDAEATATLREGLVAFPDSSLLRTALGQRMVVAGEIDAGLEELRKAAECDPESGLPHYMLCWSRFLLGGFDEARREFLIGEPHGFEFGTSHDNFVHCLFFLGRFGDAGTALRTLTERDGPRLSEENRRWISQLGDRVKELAGREKELVDILKDPDLAPNTDPRVAELLAKLSEPFAALLQNLPDAEVSAYLETHPGALQAMSEERELTTISIVRGEETESIAARIRERLAGGQTVEEATKEFEVDTRVIVGARSWTARSDLVDFLQEPAFRVEPGGVSEAIGGTTHWFIVCVHGRRDGQAADVNGAAARQRVREKIIAGRRRNWEAWYLAGLKQRERVGER